MDSEMDVETEALSIIKCSKPTTSLEAKLSNFPLLRESDNSVDPIQATFSSSSVLTPSEPTRILMISLPRSSDSVNKNTVEEDPVFLTPPESRSVSYLSSEDQNHNHCCAEGMTIFEAEKGSYRKTKVRVLEAVFDDELEANRIGVEPGEDFEGETVPLDDTEVVQIEADEVVRDSNVVSNNGDSTLSLTEGSLDITGKAVTIDLVEEVGVLMKDNVAKFDGNKGNHELEKKRECVDYDKIETVPLDDTEVVQIETEEAVRDINVVSDNKGNHELEKKREFRETKVDMLIKRLRGGIGKCHEVKQKSDASGAEKLKAAEVPKDIQVDECVRSKGAMIQEIEEFRYAGDATRKRGGTVGVSGGRRQLKRKEKKVVGGSGKESGLLDLLDKLLEDKDDDSDSKDVDIMETAKQCGWNFPRPRWWPPEGEDWSP